MHVAIIFHEVNAVPFNRVADDANRLAVQIALFSFVNAFDNRGDVMPVNAVDVPAEGAPLIFQRFLSEHLFREVNHAHMVSVYQNCQI